MLATQAGWQTHPQGAQTTPKEDQKDTLGVNLGAKTGKPTPITFFFCDRCEFSCFGSLLAPLWHQKGVDYTKRPPFEDPLGNQLGQAASAISSLLTYYV